MDDCLLQRVSPIIVLILTVLLTGEALALAGEPDCFCGEKGTLMVAGGTAHLPVMIEAAKRVHMANPEIYINVVGGGSTLGIRKVGEGLVHIGNSGRPLYDAERKKYSLVSYPLALDGIAVVVHAGNPVTNLSRQQVADIFSGVIRNWRQLGGSDAPIMLYGRKEGSATLAVFEQEMFGRRDASAPCSRIPSNSGMRNIIAIDSNGIGYLSIGFLDSNKVRGIILDGVVPSQQNVLDGTYKLARTLFMHTAQQPSKLARCFIEYLKSREGAALIRESGSLPLP